ncbi:MAG: hypothetical protein FWC43_05140 [Planctomycetaceae bacterium]|nr:hypothetical protein [Planctomycetaceae bacterium]
MPKSIVIALFSLIVLLNGANAQTYKSPYQLTATKDGSKVYILNHESNEISVLDTTDDKIVQTIPVGFSPNSMVLSRDEKLLYLATGAEKGVLQVLNLASGQIEKNVPADHSPCGLSLSPDGKMLVVCNRFLNTVSFYELPGFKKIRTVSAIREPRGSVVTLDGKTVFVINFLPNDPADSFDVASEVTTIDVATGAVENIRLPNGSSSLHGICLSPDGKYVYLTEILARYQMPTTQIERGWMNTNGFSILDAQTKTFINTILIDDVDLGASNPWGIATSADGKQLYITVSGTHELCVVDVEGMLKKLLSLPKTQEEAKAAGTYDNRGTFSSATVAEVPNDLAFLVGLKKRVKLGGYGSRGLAVAGDKVYVGMYFSDEVKKVDFSATLPKVSTIPLGPAQELTDIRKGERHWNDATLCFQAWQSCASCHPDARVDGLNWDLLNDGLGNPKNAKSLLQSHLAPPAMWEGVRKTSSYAIRTGFRYILFAVPNEQICDEVDAYLQSLEPLASPHLVNGELSESARRGKELFESKRINCTECHPAPIYTDMKMHDVGSKNESFDRRADFDTPGLVEVWRTAPYLHDGRYVKMRDVFAVGKHGDVSGDVDTLTEQELDDLTEYVLSL